MSLFSKGADTPAAPIAELVPGDGKLHCRIETSLGDMVAELFETDAPRTVANFVALALGKVEWTDPQGKKSSNALYSGTIFHRVIPGFMIQGGDPTGTGRGGPGWRFQDEFSPKRRHVQKGVLSMANAGPGTNGSQFFITEGPTPHLDNRHTVFGQVVEGIDVVAKIAGSPRDGNDRPRKDVVLRQISVYRA